MSANGFDCAKRWGARRTLVPGLRYRGTSWGQWSWALRHAPIALLSPAALELLIDRGNEPRGAGVGSAGGLGIVGRRHFRAQHFLQRLTLRDHRAHLVGDRDDHVALRDDIVTLDD